MLKHEFDFNGTTLKPIYCFALVMTLILAFGCAPKKENGEKTVREVKRTDQTGYHADNDIAMTMRSIADALKVGEPLDSAEYDFEGILTDGQGSPLYTDVQGSPGLWQIDVLDKKNVMIRNLYLGDLLPLDLQTYILQTLRIPAECKVDFVAHDAVSDDETEIELYDCEGVWLRFEVRSGMAPNGLEGPMLNIIMSADPPAMAEIQTDP